MTIVRFVANKRELLEQILGFDSLGFTIVLPVSFYCFSIDDRTWKIHVHKQQEETVVICQFSLGAKSNWCYQNITAS